MVPAILLQCRIPISTRTSSRVEPSAAAAAGLLNSVDLKREERVGGGRRFVRETRARPPSSRGRKDDTPGREARHAVAEDDVEAHREQAQGGDQPPPQVSAAYHQPRPGTPAARPPSSSLASLAYREGIWRPCRICGLW
jgi:hypothetical protein